MRTIAALAITIAGLTLSGCGNTTVEKETAVSSEIVKASFNTEGAPTVGLNIPGMHCQSCAGSICEVLEEVPGVVDIKTDVESKTATLAIDKAAFNTEAAIDALTEAAFEEATLMATAVETNSDPLIIVEEEPASEVTDPGSKEPETADTSKES